MYSIYISFFTIIFTIECNALMNASEKAFILFTETYHRNIVKVNLSNQNKTLKWSDTQILSQKKESALGWAVELDYSLSGNLLLWNSEDSNMASPLDKTLKNSLGINATKVLNKMQIPHDSQMAFDWIHDLLYFTDMHEINVISIMNTNLRYVVIKNRIDVIINIVIDPLESFIFWIECNDNHNNYKIMRSYEDGSGVTVLVNSSLKQLNGIALDLQHKNLYWIDSGLYTLSSIDYNGNKRQIILKSQNLFIHCHHMDFFEDYIFWSNPNNRSVLKTHKSGLNGTARLALMSYTYIKAMKIVHPLRQPFSVNRCLNSNCSHFCLPNGINSFRCLCPSIKYYKFNENEKCFTQEIGENSVKISDSFRENLGNSSNSHPVLTSLLVVALIIQFAVIVFLFLKYFNFDNSYFRRISRIDLFDDME